MAVVLGESSSWGDFVFGGGGGLGREDCFGKTE